MGDLAPPRAFGARAASASIFVATIAGTLIVIGLVLSLDLFLARIDRRESDDHAASEYAAGIALLRDGHAADAAERFGTAVSIDRANLSYSLALAEAMLEEGRAADAEATLRGLLERSENDGAINLTMAHVMQREGRIEEAKAYLHRAVFGRWGADSLAARRGARFELIDLLARTGASRELLAEILPFEETSLDSLDFRRRLGHLFILAGSPARAANIFRDVLRRSPEDPDAYAGMGEAALALGNFRTARADFAEAARRRPDDADIAGRLAIADTVLALDPNARAIGSAEQYARSRALLVRTLALVAPCGIALGAAGDSAQQMLARSPAARGPDAMTERMIALSIDLWAMRPSSCAVAKRDEAVRIVIDRLAQ